MSDSTPTPAWKVEFNDRIRKFAETIGKPVEEVEARFKGMGLDGTAEEHLDWLGDPDIIKFGELREIFKDVGVIKIRAAIKHLLGRTEPAPSPANGDASAAAIQQLADSMRPLDRMSDRELLERLDRGETEIAEILRKRSHGHRFVVLTKDGAVDVEESLKVLKIAKRQMIPETLEMDGSIVSPVRAGEWPVEYLEASPFFPSNALVSGYCSESDTNWSDVPNSLRVMSHLHVFKIETAKLNMSAMKQICEDAKKGNDHFRNVYRKAAQLYDKLEAQDDLPKLRISPNEVRPGRHDGRSDTGF